MRKERFLDERRRLYVAFHSEAHTTWDLCFQQRRSVQQSRHSRKTQIPPKPSVDRVHQLRQEIELLSPALAHDAQLVDHMLAAMIEYTAYPHQDEKPEDYDVDAEPWVRFRDALHIDLRRFDAHARAELTGSDESQELAICNALERDFERRYPSDDDWDFGG